MKVDRSCGVRKILSPLLRIVYVYVYVSAYFFALNAFIYKLIPVCSIEFFFFVLAPMIQRVVCGKRQLSLISLLSHGFFFFF